MGVRTLTRNVLRPGYFRTMAHKLYLRTRYRRRELREAPVATAWAAEQAEDMDTWATGLDAALWREAKEAGEAFRAGAQPRLRELLDKGVDLGGGAAYELLYFVTRLRRPEHVLETGVAAGWSTAAVLAAIARNGRGHLSSSDFPYFQLDDPGRYVGLLVPDELRGPWTLHLDGDRRNLPRILGEGMVIDVAHYDSDKTASGREFFYETVAPKLSDDAVVVMDDIGDNLWFRDRVAAERPTRVFTYRDEVYDDKYVGVIGL